MIEQDARVQIERSAQQRDESDPPPGLPPDSCEWFQHLAAVRY